MTYFGSYYPPHFYEGQFQNGHFNGYGRVIYADGEKYEGEFKDDRLHGFGKRIDPDGKVSEGIWENGLFECEEEVKEKL